MDLNQLAQQAHWHLSRGDSAAADPIVSALQQAAPDDRMVKSLTAQLAVVGFHVSASRMPAEIPANRSVAQHDVDLVAFHVDLPANPSGIHRPIDYQSVLRSAFAAAAIKAPAARRIVLTDENTDIAPDIGAHQVIRHSLDTSALMYERMRLQIAYLEDRPEGRASVLMDTDVVINRDPAEVFRLAFDVGLTWRTGFPDAPFNGGLIFVGPGHKGRGFLADARACYDNLVAAPELNRVFPLGLRGWWGDQFALAALTGYRDFAQRQSEGSIVNGALVAYLPCERFNFTLEPGMNYSLAEVRQKFCIHFKGNRKGMLAKYLEMMQAGRI